MKHIAHIQEGGNLAHAWLRDKRPGVSFRVVLSILHGWAMTGEKRYSHAPFLHMLDLIDKKHFFDAVVLPVPPTPHLESIRSISPAGKPRSATQRGQHHMTLPGDTNER